ncbi:S8 family serine peptidase [Thermus sp. 2.9]|uniref:S8 family peptidase n=1 Tax=Thermus sp. (strain 2.9) TaxID=1577051 RepID=UPI00350F09DC
MPRGLGDFSAPHVPGELLVFAEGFTPQGLANRVEGVVPLKVFQGGFLHVRVPPGWERAKAEALLRAGARWVQPNYIYEPLALPPNDPLYAPYQKPQLSGLVGLEAAWANSTGDPDLILAVVDTGYLPHKDMGSRWYRPQGCLDVADNDQDPTDDIASQDRGHGLAVASVIGAETNNALGMAGVTWRGKLLPLKVARSSDGLMSTAYVREAVDLAVQLGAKVINLSLGAPGSDPVLEQSLSAARAQGVVLVAAAGNDGIDGVLYPASSPSVIAVGSVSNDKSKSYFSNYGPELDLVAPGERVTVLLPNNGYGFGSGTSFASPIVAGVVALYMSKYASERKVWPTPDQVYQCLTATAEDLGPSGRDDEYGFGLVRADRVMADLTHCFP